MKVTLLDQARAYLEQGAYARAKEAYIAALLPDRYHIDGMLGLAAAYVGLEDFPSAHTVLARAVARHPHLPEAHADLGAVLIELDQLAAAREALLDALRISPFMRKAWCALGVVFERQGDLEQADHAWAQAFRDGGPALSTFRGERDPVPVLLLWSAVDGNVPVKPFLDERVFQWSTLFVESYLEGMPLPPHAVVFNAVGNADLPIRALERAESIARATHAPVVNQPARVRRTGRAAVAERLREIPGVVTPRMTAVARRDLREGRLQGLSWPLLIRAPGFHSGRYFERVSEPAELPGALAAVPGEDLLAIEFLDTREDDGWYRKYRVLTIDGRLYPLHVASSRDWKVHAFSAGRHDAFALEGLDPPAQTALERAADALGLDYGGIDFALAADGRVVIFEANATMRIVPVGSGPRAIDGSARRAAEAAVAMIAQRAKCT